MLFLIAVLAVMTCIPLLQSWYTTTDDILIALGLQQGVKMVGFGTAEVTGRLQHVITGSLAPMAYGWGNYWLMKTLGIGAVLASVAAMAWAVRLVSGSVRFAALTVVFFFAFAQNTHDHNLLTAFPFISTSALAIFWMSVGTWWLALHGRAWLGVVSVTLFVVSLLAYENFLVYGCIFPVLTIVARTGTWKERIWQGVWTPHVLATVLMVFAIVGFRAAYQTDYGKQAMSVEQYEVSIDPGRMAKVMGRYATSAFPLHYARPYREVVTDFYQGYGRYRITFRDMFGVFDAGWMAKALIAAYLAVVLLLRRENEPVRQRAALWFTTFVLVILTNFPLSITTKYQIWVIERMSQGYLTSYFVLFGVVILIALVLDGAVDWVARRARWGGRAVAVLFGLIVFLVTYQTELVNAHVSLAQHRMYQKWQTVDEWIDSPAFKAVPEGSLILAPTLFEHYPLTVTVFDDYWTQYVQSLAKKKVEVINHLADWRTKAATKAESARLYHLGFSQPPRGDDSYLTFSEVPAGGDGVALGSREVQLLAHAKADRFRVFGRLFGTGSCRARIFVDGVPTNSLFSDRFAAQVDRPRNAREWLWTRFTSEGGTMDPASFLVTDSALDVDRPINLLFGRGFHEDELAYRWSEETAVLTLWNREARPLRAALAFEVQAPGAGDAGAQLTATAGAVKARWPVGREYAKRSLQLEIPAASTLEVVFTSDASRADVPLDSRKLVLRFGPGMQARELGCETGS